MSGLWAVDLIRFGIVAVEIGYFRSGPLFVDFDQDSGDEPFEGRFVCEDSNFLCPAFQLLLDGSFDWVRRAHAAPVGLRQFEHSQAFGHRSFEPACEFRC